MWGVSDSHSQNPELIEIFFILALLVRESRVIRHRWRRYCHYRVSWLVLSCRHCELAIVSIPLVGQPSSHQYLKFLSHFLDRFTPRDDTVERFSRGEVSCLHTSYRSQATEYRPATCDRVLLPILSNRWVHLPSRSSCNRSPELDLGEVVWSLHARALWVSVSASVMIF